MPKSKKKANVKIKQDKVNDDKIKNEPELDFDLDLGGLKLEEDVETQEQNMTNLDLKNLEFGQFTNLPNIETEKGNVALERMALSAPRPIFVGGIPQGISGANEDDSFSYSGKPGATEPKYIESPDTSTAEIERIDSFSSRRRDEFTLPKSDFLVQRFGDSRISESSSPERIERVNRFEDDNFNGKNRFDREEEKYSRYKPNAPKG